MAVKADVFKEIKFQRFSMGKLQRREAFAGILMSLPFVLGFLLLTLGPMLVGLYASFTKWDIVSAPRWIGLDNFTRMFSGGDRYFYPALNVTIKYTLISAPIHLVLSIVLASLLNMKLKGTNIFRSVFYLPYILPIVATIVLVELGIQPGLRPGQLCPFSDWYPGSEMAGRSKIRIISDHHHEPPVRRFWHDGHAGRVTARSERTV
jgi:ABC-type polysaccharide transport system permease subunit